MKGNVCELRSCDIEPPSSNWWGTFHWKKYTLILMTMVDDTIFMLDYTILVKVTEQLLDIHLPELARKE